MEEIIRVLSKIAFFLDPEVRCKIKRKLEILKELKYENSVSQCGLESYKHELNEIHNFLKEYKV